MVTVINDAAENSGLLSNNPCAQGAFEGRGPVAKETDDIQNGPRSTVLFSFCFFSSSPTDFVFFSPSFFCFGTSCRATFEGGVFFVFFFLGGGGLLESFVLFVRRCSIRVCVHIDLITQLRY